MADETDAKRVQAPAETLEALFEVSQILNTGIDRETLSIIVGMCENGVNPEALAAVIRELRREGAELKNAMASEEKAK